VLAPSNLGGSAVAQFAQATDAGMSTGTGAWSWRTGKAALRGVELGFPLKPQLRVAAPDAPIPRCARNSRQVHQDLSRPRTGILHHLLGAPEDLWGRALSDSHHLLPLRGFVQFLPGALQRRAARTPSRFFPSRLRGVPPAELHCGFTRREGVPIGAAGRRRLTARCGSRERAAWFLASGSFPTLLASGVLP
jgi:hypothetical protein